MPDSNWEDETLLAGPVVEHDELPMQGLLCVEAEFVEPPFMGLIGPFPSRLAAENFMQRLLEIRQAAGKAWTGSWNLTTVRTPTSLEQFVEEHR